jgi:transcription elongation factor SPT5
VPSSKTKANASNQFVPGDTVMVSEGELINLLGTVLKIEDNVVTIMPKHEDLKDPLEFPANELRKYFKLGDHVKVILGQHEGDTGLIVRVENNVAVLVSDLTLHEVCTVESICHNQSINLVLSLYLLYNYKSYTIELTD